MEQNLIDIYDLIEHAIDNAFEGKMNLKFYEYLKDAKIKKNEIQVRESKNLRPISIKTEPYPGFPTDLQAQTMVLMTKAKGKSNKIP